MLQLGLPSFIQRPLIDQLVAQMYHTRLDSCHLMTLEMTVGRFYSQGVAVLDPVINHLIGTYSLRSLQDRNGPDNTAHKSIDPIYKVRRQTLRYDEANDIERRKTVVIPPKLPVLGHSIRNWSGVRRDGKTSTAYTGYPLNIGRVKKFYRRNGQDQIKNEKRGRDFVEYSTYRLRKNESCRDNPPGGAVTAAASAVDDIEGSQEEGE
ncbi:hypothetical protein GQ44DRAFT_717857 [Phaeosphaeriaceae sp. PMI808]|nr:hypothetical protein GQ44DRAFT_717857 [Phaeosphaeriaceae sp. PMI808]